MKKKIANVVALCCGMMMAVLPMAGRRVAWGKLSPMLRSYVSQENGAVRMGHGMATVFIKMTGDADSLLQRHGGRVLARFGNVYVACVPLGQVGNLSLCQQVLRIEAEQGNRALLDSTALHVGARLAHEGTSLPQAFTGKGVVMGVMDIGFDLTHPTFRNPDTGELRIKALWDQVAPGDGSLYVGRAYEGESELLALGHCYDGQQQYHGTHTLGIAAGTGCGSPYRGMAYESDICLVANAVSDDQQLIDPSEWHKYTYALDALGFKYIFDYADSQGKPCVISFSEGSRQDFEGYDILYNEVLDSLTSHPGHILVASAGNEGYAHRYLHKPGQKSAAGTFVRSSSPSMVCVAKSAKPFSLLFKWYGNQGETIGKSYSLADVVASADSLLQDTINVPGTRAFMSLVAYRSCYDNSQLCCQVSMKLENGENPGSFSMPVSLELRGEGADVEAYAQTGIFENRSLDRSLCDSEAAHNILSPGSLPSVVCVGATGYRDEYTDYKGEVQESSFGKGGVLSPYSSQGPTFDGRIKPDVVAPGSNVISSYSSFCPNPHPDDVVSTFDFEGRSYGWKVDTGTSMSAPVVGGVVALWLQANPRLTRQDVVDVLAHTCSHYDATLSYPNNAYGYGQVDAYRGLLYIMGLDGIEGISTHQPQKARIVMGQGGKLVVSLDAPAQKPFTLRVYATSGALLRQYAMPSGKEEYQADMGSLPRAVYAVQLTGAGDITGSQLVAR